MHLNGPSTCRMGDGWISVAAVVALATDQDDDVISK